LGPPSFSSSDQTYAYQTDFLVMGTPSGNTSVSGALSYVGWGCSSADYQSFPAGQVALILRGNCTFQDKANFAIAGGASGALIYNNGTGNGGFGLIPSSVSASIPVLSLTYGVGLKLFYTNPTQLSISTSNYAGNITTYNIHAKTQTGNATSIIVVGSHLDSVPAGPGINDNGSGSSLNLDLALQVYRSGLVNYLQNQIQFSWWGGEELGLLGSYYFVNNLNQTNPGELANIALNLNFDMVGSPNYFFGIYNGSNAEDPAIRPGSGAIQSLFNQTLTDNNIPCEPTDFNGRSDYAAFIANGIPAGGLATGAEGIKTQEQKLRYGGLAQVSYDPCYHQSCDNVANIAEEAITAMSYGAAATLQQLALKPDLRKFLNP